MQQFDSYIKSILNGLEINQKHKNEMAEEFSDHLEMLKKEYMNEGFEENEAINKSIESFGNDKKLKNNLTDSINNYRNLPNIIFGTLFYCTHIFIMYIMSMSHRDIKNVVDVLLNNLSIIILISFIGYFLPILFKKMKKIQNIIAVSIITGTLLGIYGVRLTLWQFIPQDVMVKVFLSVWGEFMFNGTLGVIFGFVLIKLFNKLSLRFKAKVRILK